jgi:predicted AAA+ superfamily ATPase
MLERPALAAELRRGLRDFPVVALVGPRQCGKTTMARGIVPPGSPSYFDLESPADLRRLAEPMTALGALEGTIVVDEVQRAPDLFPVLRVLADERPLRRRVLVLGSASPGLLRQTSESLAGRVRVIEMGGFDLRECGIGKLDRRWLRGGYPRAFLARTERATFEWLDEFVRSLVERDLPFMDSRMPAAELRRLLAMLAHYHGQTLNTSELASSLGVARETVRRYVDLLAGLFHLRQLQPWFENLGKRQVKSGRLLFRDTGVLHAVMGIRSRRELLVHPRLGASWEGFALEEVLRQVPHDEAYWWATYQGAELDLLLFRKGRRFGVEVKRADAPRMTPSIATALRDLKLDAVTVIAPVAKPYAVDAFVRVISLEQVLEDPEQLVIARQPRR